MPYAKGFSGTPSGGAVELYYETRGDPGGVPLALVMGLGSQLVSWPDGLVDAFVERGFHVVLYDNRDVGLSTKIDTPGLPLLPSIMAAISGEPVSPPYRVADMAGDLAAVLDAAGLDAAHILGVSMGGMIAQQFAIDRPDRTLSLTSIMSTTGDRDVGAPRPDVVGVLYETAPADREGYVAHSIETSRAIGSPDYFDEELARRKAERSFDRGYYPEGTGRQLLAIVASGSRSAGLAQLSVPALVVHGDADPLVDISGGRRTAEVIPGAQFLELPGMGHDLPAVFWPRIVDAVAALTTRTAAAVDTAG